MIMPTWEMLQSYIYTGITGLIILLVGFGLGFLVKNGISVFLRELELNRVAHKVKPNYNLEMWLSNVMSYIIYLVTIIIFLKWLGIGLIILYAFFGALLLLIILTFLVGLKDIIPNLAGWFVLQKRTDFKIGNTIKVKNIYGTVEKISFLETIIKTDRGDLLYVPNVLFRK